MKCTCLTTVVHNDKRYEIGEVLNIDDPSQLLSVGAVKIVQEAKVEQKEEKKKVK